MANKLIKDESFKKGGKPLSINKQKTHHGAMQMPNFNLNKYIGHKDGGITKGTAMKKSDMKEDMKMDMAQDKAMIKKAVKMHDTQMHGGKKTDMKALKKGGAMHKMPDGSMMAGKSHGMAKGGCMANGGMPMVEKGGKKVPAFAADGVGKMAKGGMCMTHGGYVRSADGVATKGKTKGRII